MLERLGEHHAAHLDLAGAYYREGQWEPCEQHARRALELGHPLPGLVHNYLACSAFARGDIQRMQDEFMLAAKADPQHYVLMSNVERARSWFRERGPERGAPLSLVARHDFQLLERTLQPTLPGPLPGDFATWGDVPVPPAPERSGPGAVHGARRLPLVSQKAS